MGGREREGEVEESELHCTCAVVRIRRFESFMQGTIDLTVIANYDIIGGGGGGGIWNKIHHGMYRIDSETQLLSQWKLLLMEI